MIFMKLLCVFARDASRRKLNFDARQRVCSQYGGGRKKKRWGEKRKKKTTPQGNVSLGLLLKRETFRLIYLRSLYVRTGIRYNRFDLDTRLALLFCFFFVFFFAIVEAACEETYTSKESPPRDFYGWTVPGDRAGQSIQHPPTPG